MVNSFKIVILSLFVASLPCGCSSDAKIKGDIKEGTIKTKEGESNPAPKTGGTTTSTVNSESVSVPGSITGAFLVCAIVEANKAVEVRVGCGFKDSEGHAIAVSAVATQSKFSIVGNQPSGIIVTELPADSVYDVIFKFNGAKFDALTAAAMAAVYQVALSGLKNGEPDRTIGGRGSVIATAPAPRWEREKSSDLNGDSLCSAGETCLYAGNGLVWYRDLAVPKGYTDAARFCDDLTDLWSDWRLPSENEMKMAFEKNITTIGFPEGLNLISEPYWTGTAADTNYSVVNPMTGNTTAAPLIENHRSLCVRISP